MNVISVPNCFYTTGLGTRQLEVFFHAKRFLHPVWTYCLHKLYVHVQFQLKIQDNLIIRQISGHPKWQKLSWRFKDVLRIVVGIFLGDKCVLLHLVSTADIVK